MKKSNKEAFQNNDFVTPDLNAPIPQLTPGHRYTVDVCVNGLTTLKDVDEPVPTETLIPYPEDTQKLIEFAVTVIGEHLVTVVEGARIACISQVYFRNIIAKEGNYELPSPIMIEVLGKQFVTKKFAQEIFERRMSKKTGEIDKMKEVQIPDNLDVNDDLESLNLSELRDFARQIQGLNVWQNKTKLILAIRIHRTNKKNKGNDNAG